jgi:hypothetical protein
MLEFQGKLYFPWNTNIPGSTLGIKSGTIGFSPAKFTSLLKPEGVDATMHPARGYDWQVLRERSNPGWRARFAGYSAKME